MSTSKVFSMDLLKVIVDSQDKTELFKSTAIIYCSGLNGY